MLQACQGDVHPENLIGSLWPAVQKSKAAPWKLALASCICEWVDHATARSLRPWKPFKQGYSFYHFHCSQSKEPRFCITWLLVSFPFPPYLLHHLPQPTKQDWLILPQRLAYSTSIHLEGAGQLLSGPRMLYFRVLGPYSPPLCLVKIFSALKCNCFMRLQSLRREAPDPCSLVFWFLLGQSVHTIKTTSTPKGGCV